MFAEAKYKAVLLCGDVAPGDNIPLPFSLSRQTGMREAINSLQCVEHKSGFHFLILKFMSQRLLEDCRLENVILSYVFGPPMVMEMNLHLQQCGAGDYIKTPLRGALL